MPRRRSSSDLSNLSLMIPRRIHRLARMNYLRSGAPSFAAYVATVLDRAPKSMDASSLFLTHAVEAEIKALGNRSST